MVSLAEKPWGIKLWWNFFGNSCIVNSMEDVVGQDNWNFVFSAVRRGGYSSAQMADRLSVTHIEAVELIYAAQSVLRRRKPRAVRSLASRKLAYMSEE